MVLDRLFIFRRWSEYIYAYNLIESSLKIKSKRIHIQNLYIDGAIRIIIQETLLVSAALKHRLIHQFSLCSGCFLNAGLEFL
uniref:Uncharacterized protein n=1 Tax=Noccaea caerulescens TaxID=107243 RepID=A0A1J3E2R0_NOCCA